LDEYEITPWDDEEERGDSVSDRMSAWAEAEALIDGFTEAYYDPNLSAPQIRRMALAEADPTFDPRSRSDSYIAGAINSLIEDDEDDSYRGDSATYDYGLDEVIASQGGSHRLRPGVSGDLYEHEIVIAQNYKKPLTVSKN
jgi:hypothetical protein